MLPYQRPAYRMLGVPVVETQRGPEHAGSAKLGAVLPPRSPYIHPQLMFPRGFPGLSQHIPVPMAMAPRNVGVGVDNGSEGAGSGGLEPAAAGRRKRRSPTHDANDQQMDGAAAGAGGAKKAKRFMWSERVHKDFVRSVFEVGLKAASPKAIVELLPSNAGLTSEHVKSHLQKFRMHGSRSKEDFLNQYNRALESTPRAAKSESESKAGADTSGSAQGASPEAVESLKRQLAALKRTLAMGAKLNEELESSLAAQQTLYDQAESRVAAIDPAYVPCGDDILAPSTSVDIGHGPLPAQLGNDTMPAIAQWPTASHARQPQAMMMMPPAVHHGFPVFSNDSYPMASRYNENSQLQLEMQIGMNMHRQLRMHKEDQVAPYLQPAQQPDQLSISAYSSPHELGNKPQPTYQSLNDSAQADVADKEHMAELDLLADDLFGFLVEPIPNAMPSTADNSGLDVGQEADGDS